MRTDISKILPLRIACVLLLATLATPACYTLLKHPRVKRVVYEEVDDKRCNTCHLEDELWSYHHPPNQWYGYGAVALDIVPWWYNDYWYYPDDGPVTVPLHWRQFRPSADKPETTMGVAPQPIQESLSPPARASENTKKGDSNAQQSKKRTVRPEKAKESGSKKKH